MKISKKMKKRILINLSILRAHKALLAGSTFVLILISVYFMIDGFSSPEQNLRHQLPRAQMQKTPPQRIGSFQALSSKPEMFQLNKTFQPSARYFDGGQQEIRRCPTSVLFVSDDETSVYSEANEYSKKLKSIVGDEFLLDARYDLVLLEKKDRWIKVRAASPEWPPDNLQWSGWIRASDLYSKKSTTDEAGCNFVDFGSWGGNASNLIFSVRQMTDNILSKDRRCNRVVHAGYIGTGQRYFISCYPRDGGRPYHYWFSLLKQSNINQNTQPASENEAFSACRNKLYDKITNLRRMKSAEEGVAVEEELENTIKVSSSSSQLDGSVWKMTMSYTDETSAEKLAYCFVDPQGLAEISFPIQAEFN